MAELIVLRKMRRRRTIENHRTWILKDRANPFSLNDRDFISRFRLSKHAVFFLCENLQPLMKEAVNGYSLEIQVLTMLRLFATGSFQSATSESHFFKVSQTFVSVTLNKFLDAMHHIAPAFVQFPRSDAELNEMCQGFYAKFGFPNVVGLIDCTHIFIKRPNCDDFYSFLGRKGKFSVNVQMVCDHNMKIIDVVARWPGSCHDTFIWHLSGLYRHLQNINNGNKNYFLLGDSGYPLEPCLMTPFQNPCCPREHTFNKMHRKCRNVIERTFGVLKGRFRLFHESGGTLQYDPQKVCKMIVAGAVLHNICLLYNISTEEFSVDSDGDDDDDDDDDTNTPNHTLRLSAVALDIRNRLATHFHAQT